MTTNQLAGAVSMGGRASATVADRRNLLPARGSGCRSRHACDAGLAHCVAVACGYRCRILAVWPQPRWKAGSA